MATNNSINLGSSGFASYNGTGTFAGRTMTAGNSSITITNGDGISGNPTFTATGGGFPWIQVSGASASLAGDTGYSVLYAGGTCTLTLPAAGAVLGQTIKIVGNNLGGANVWLIAQNASQEIIVGASTSTVGVGGSVQATGSWNCITLVCIAPGSGSNSIWIAEDWVGSLTVV